ncbi:50S ribosomal protein L18 [Candidatus Ornithobacterium hominis]|uniref:Large ribosomal subunit protein uL18 n=1 Tax=Candidatus Ornithobacterium hominis TaxID=2497989 RepID=A0A383TZU8_9FLAO|nr:50S ribosomal protein L18 [Candidatus Ornithobacterium hominis]MCT7904041.1 50S ribosomal protein L18 [Candidatus Ornithobacterium hominis]CAI9430020.1 50S ribosomal protein L18 [Candidatus Ornithobacterium hominis]SZD72421.1 50S ribosomal protein L18 [Candidatus Ornithobacterium hominis]SZD72708.1 50S ribosomal protein L18 [Candidatus Ornithobacterium hominis]
MAFNRKENRVKIKRRVRKNIFGTSDIPRLSVFRSNKEIYAQIIDDTKGVTLVSASSRDKSIDTTNKPKIEVSKLVGNLVANKAKGAGIEKVVFDRNGFLYHGRIKSLAEGAREGGLKF